MQPQPPVKDHLDKAIDDLKKRGVDGPSPSDLVQIYNASQSEEGIRGKTILTPALQNMIYVYDMMDKKYPGMGLSKAAERLAHLLISRNGTSREQGIKLFHGLMDRLRNESLSIETGRTQPPQNPVK